MIIGCNFIRAMYGGVRIEGINSLTQVYLDNQSWSNKEDLSGQLKPIKESLQKIKEALVE